MVPGAKVGGVRYLDGPSHLIRALDGKQEGGSQIRDRENRHGIDVYVHGGRRSRVLAGSAFQLQGTP